VTLAYIVLLVIAGLRAHSLALLSEAGHNLTDFIALLMSWAQCICKAAASARKTFGYNRAGVLAAFINGLTLILISFYIWYERSSGCRLRYKSTPCDDLVAAAAW